MFYGIFFWITFTSVTFLTLLTVILLPGEERRRWAAGWGARTVFTLTGAWPDIAGLENVPKRQCIVVANHCSYLDGILLTALLPARFNFIIKREMATVPIAGFLLRRLGSEFVERFESQGTARDSRRILQLVDRGQSLTFFPEGTFNEDPGLLRFHTGAFRAAQRANLPIVPVVIRGTRQMLPADRWLPRYHRLSVQFMAAVKPDGDDLGNSISRVRQMMLESLGEPDRFPQQTGYGSTAGGSTSIANVGDP